MSERSPNPKRKTNYEAVGSSGKKLRYAEPDLRVIIINHVVVDDDDDDEYDDDNEATKTTEEERVCYDMYGQNLARLSSFVDTTLSIDMREKNNMEITFHGISPKLFEKAIKFLEDPLSTRSMTPQDSLELIPFYDQYQFAGGLVLCDKIIFDFVQGQQKQHQQNNNNIIIGQAAGEKPPKDLDLLVQSAALSHKYPDSLIKSRPKLIAYLNSKFRLHITFAYGPTMFTEDHIRLLQPMFLEGILNPPDGFTQEDLESTMFPKYYTKCMACDFATNMVQHLTLGGTGTHDGRFRRERPDSFIAPFRCEMVEYWDANDVVVDDDGTTTTQRNRCKREEVYFQIRKTHIFNNGGDWAIVCSPVQGTDSTQQHVLWNCPHSKNLTIPPSEPWFPVNVVNVDRKPKIRYN